MICGLPVSHQVQVQEPDLKHLPATWDYMQEASDWKKQGLTLSSCSVPDRIPYGSCTKV